jgi:hypothetical protein
MALGDIRRMAAWHALGLVKGEDLRRAADDALTEGIYSWRLGELATLPRPIMADAEPLFAAALRELGLEMPSDEVAFRLLTLDDLGAIAEGACLPLEGLTRWDRGLYDRLRWDRSAEPFVERLGLHDFVRTCWDFRALAGGTNFDLEVVEDRFGALADRALAFAIRWARAFGRERVDPRWREGDGGLVLALARGIDQERAFDRLPVLADALEDAGCTDRDLLDHCRSGSVHKSGCWLIDAIVGRSS